LDILTFYEIINRELCTLGRSTHTDVKESAMTISSNGGRTRFTQVAGLLVVLFLLSGGVALAADAKDMGGWEVGSPYNAHYDAKELDYFRATIVSIEEVVPMAGMAPAVALWVKESEEDDPVMVHLCPVWFAEPSTIGLKKGDRVKIKGVWTEIEGKDVFMASKVKMGDFFQFKVRLTKDGFPFWAMDPEQLAKERASD
jgi:hypothetical protein